MVKEVLLNSLVEGIQGKAFNQYILLNIMGGGAKKKFPCFADTQIWAFQGGSTYKAL